MDLNLKRYDDDVLEALEIIFSQKKSQDQPDEEILNWGRDALVAVLKNHKRMKSKTDLNELLQETLKPKGSGWVERGYVRTLYAFRASCPLVGLATSPSPSI
eukprot:Trichotokara_eunicae@DN6335_c0_g1_i3.p1